MASTLYIQMPPKSVADVTPGWNEHAFPFCLVSGDKRPLQHGRQNLQDLREFSSNATQVVLLLASSDVSFFNVDVPPMPMQKLRSALPNLLEEQLLVDPSELLFVCSNPVDSRCDVAVVSRTWMETLLQMSKVLDARKLSAFPSALALPWQSDQISAALEPVVGIDDELMLSVKTSMQFAAGIPIFTGAENLNSEQAAKALGTLELFTGGNKVQLFVDPQIKSIFDQLSATNENLEVKSLDWSHKVVSDLPPMLNLFSLLVQENQASFDWGKWRWSIILATSIVLISILGLNWEWYRLKTEAASLNASLISTYKNLFPNETSLRDPLLQLQQKINQSKKLAGQSTEEDFLVMSGQLAQAWQSAHPQGAQLAGLEYKEKSLIAKPKNSGEVQVDQLRSALREYGLKLSVKDGSYFVTRDNGSEK